MFSNNTLMFHLPLLRRCTYIFNHWISVRHLHVNGRIHHKSVKRLKILDEHEVRHLTRKKTWVDISLDNQGWAEEGMFTLYILTQKTLISQKFPARKSRLHPSPRLSRSRFYSSCVSPRLENPIFLSLDSRIYLSPGLAKSGTF